MCGRYYIDGEGADEELRQIIEAVNRGNADVKISGEIRPGDVVPVLANSASLRPGDAVSCPPPAILSGKIAAGKKSNMPSPRGEAP